MLRRAIALLRGLSRRRHVDAETDEELRFHLAQETDANMARGMSPIEARRAAARDLGGLVQTQEAVRDVRALWIDAVWRDIRYACRRLRRERGFAATAIFTLALGIGANTAVMTIVHGTLSRVPAGLEKADGLVWITAKQGPHQVRDLTEQQIDDLRARIDLFKNVAGETSTTVELGGVGDAMRARAIEATPEYFETLGTPLVRGRPFRRSAVQPEAIIGEALWRDRLNGGDDAIGAQILINTLTYTIVGVAPRGFRGASLVDSADDASGPQVWLSSAAHRALSGDESFDADHVVARLAPGASLELTNKWLNSAGARWSAMDARLARLLVQATPLQGANPGAAIAPQMWLILVFPAVVLLIACANVSALLLARGVTRAHEIAIRTALGASRWQIVRQSLIENALLAQGGGAIGLCVSLVATPWLISGLHLVRVAVTPDPTILAFTCCVCVFSVLLFGVAPAILDSKPRRFPGLRSGDAVAMRTPRRAGIQRALVVAQIALSLVLLASGAVMVQAVRHLMATDVGFDVSDAVLNVSFDLDAHAYAVAPRLTFWDDLVRQTAALPGVSAVALAEVPPFIGRIYYGSIKDASRAPAYGIRVSPHYFETIRQPLVGGREFTAADSRDATPVAIVSEALARSRWPLGGAMGAQFPLNESGATGRQKPTMVSVVGIVKDLPIPERSAFGVIRPQFYLPLQQHQTEAGHGWSRASLLVRTAGDAMHVLPDVRHVVRELDPNVSLFDVATMRGLELRITEPQHTASRAIALLGLVALLMATIGTFGVMSHAMAQRTREAGIRMALGARPTEILRLSVSEGGRIIVAGLAIGLPLCVASSRVLRSLVVPGQPVSPIAIASTILLVITTILAACYLPAQRLARTNPATVLKTDG